MGAASVWAQQPVPLVPSASDGIRQGFIRVINYSPRAGSVSIIAIDDAGIRADELTFKIGGYQTAHFNSDDLENGNVAKGLPSGTGPGEGYWRLELTSDLDIESLTYIRTSDGFLTSMHDVVYAEANTHRVGLFNPGSNTNQRSMLRLVNPGTEPAEVTIVSVDDRGASPGRTVQLTTRPQGALTLGAPELESGASDFAGSLGDGTGKWRLEVVSRQPIAVMSLLASRTGHLTNLSTGPPGVDAVSNARPPPFGTYIDSCTKLSRLNR